MTNKTVRSIICDHCDRELVEDTPYPARYSLELMAVNTNINTSGSEYAVCVYPPIKGIKHFCDFKCLNEWVMEHKLKSEVSND